MDFYETDMGHSVGRGLWEVLHVFNTLTQDGTLLLFFSTRTISLQILPRKMALNPAFVDERQEINMPGKNMCKHCASPKFGQIKRYMSGRILICCKSTQFGCNFKGTKMKLRRRGRSGWWWDVLKRQRRVVEERCHSWREVLTHCIQHCDQWPPPGLSAASKPTLGHLGQLNVQASKSAHDSYH